MPRLSVVLISYNMARELPRTLKTFSPSMQRGISCDDYEIIVVDNGSTQPFEPDELRKLAPNLTIHRMERPTPSPVPAVNVGMRLARGDLVGVCIDGARMASPGLFARALAASRLHPRPVIGALSFHLGPEVQMESVKKGYDQQREDLLLNGCGWETDAYRLFSISVFASSSARGWLTLPAESNAFFMRAQHWRDLGGWDERFESPGGGLANLDMWARACADQQAEVIMLLGEATFHQVHGGVATNAAASPWEAFEAEYVRLRGAAFRMPERRALFFGDMPAPALASLRQSLEAMAET